MAQMQTNTLRTEFFEEPDIYIQIFCHFPTLRPVLVGGMHGILSCMYNAVAADKSPTQEASTSI